MKSLSQSFLPELIVDLEASGLKNSYPIEIAIADRNRREIRAWLIRPDVAWSTLEWSRKSQRIHGLAYEVLVASGRPSAEIAPEILRFVDGRAIASDNPAFDKYWLDMLFESATGKPFEGAMTDIDELSLSQAWQSRPASIAEQDDFARSANGTIVRNMKAGRRNKNGYSTILEARSQGHDHSAGGDVSSWAAALDLLESDTPIDEMALRDAFATWRGIAAAAMPWRDRKVSHRDAFSQRIG